MKLLDIGCGNNPKIIEGYETTGFDRYDFSKDCKDISFSVGNMIEKWPFPDNEFDMTHSHHVYEHIPHTLLNGDDALIFVMNEMARVTKVGGELHIIVPWIEHTNAWRHPGHYRFYNYDIFNWFTCDNPSPDIEAYGFKRNLKIIRNEIIDKTHIYAIFKKIC